ncbi:NAD-binding protein, partial [Escherichia coli]|nr:NAD-binding protein [Escherichia coli]
LTEVPKKLVVIGGGYIGTELGGAFANLGTELTILEGGPEILPTYEKDMVSLVKRNLKSKNVEMVTKALAKSAEETENGVKVTY